MALDSPPPKFVALALIRAEIDGVHYMPPPPPPDGVILRLPSSAHVKARKIGENVQVTEKCSDSDDI